MPRHRPPGPEGGGEAALAALWAGQRLPPEALRTVEGEPLRVISPGRPNGGAGPDFRDAAVLLESGVLLQGDVEVHVRASDFRRHGHHRDPAYDGVVLHVVQRADEGPRTRGRGGRTVPVLALPPGAAAAGGTPAGWAPPCAGAVARLGPAAVRALLERLGEERLRRRAAALAPRTAALGDAGALYAALAEALGLGGDREGFARVARSVPLGWLWEQAAGLPPARAVRLLDAALLGAAGLLREGDALHRTWRGLGAPGPREGLAPFRGRPANRPERRLLGLSRLLVRHGGPGLAAALAAAVLAGPRPLLRALTVRERDAALIGPGRACELAVNAVLPVLLAVAERDGRPELRRAVLEAYAGLPSPGEYGALRPLTAVLRGPDGRALAAGARRQQGALALLHGECRRGRCGRCPLS